MQLSSRPQTELNPVRRLLPALVVVLLAPGLYAQTGVIGDNGGFMLRYGGATVFTGDSLLVMDEHWKGLDRMHATRPRIRRRGNRSEVRFESRLITLTKSVINTDGQTEARWEFEVKPDARARNIELCVRIPAPVLAEFAPVGKGNDALRSEKGFTLDSFLGRFVLDFTGSTAPWSLDDLRKTAWSHEFRLRFAPPYDPKKGCRAVAVLRVEAEPSRHSAFVPLNIGAAANRGLTDDIADDGKGGWTDQGPNDLRVFRPGKHTFIGVPFTVTDRAVVLRGKERPGFPLTSGPVAVGRKLDRIYFLLTAAWQAEFRQPVAEVVVTYADGRTAVVPVRYGIEVNDWWGGVEPLAARVAWRGNNGQADVGLYFMRWKTPRPETVIRSIEFRSTDSGSVPILLAATGVAAGGLAPDQLTLLDQVFAERENPVVDTRSWFPCRIAWNDGIQPGTALDRSDLNHKPAGKFGFLEVRNGHFVFADADGRPVRFWGTNAALHGPFPPKEDAPGIARCLARQGANLVRLHLYAIYDKTMIAPDGNLDPEALDRFEYFIAELKKNGVYVYMDLNDGMLFGRLLQKKLPGGSKGLKLASIFDRDLIDAQKKLARMLFTHRNPYTKLRTCDDPAVCMYEITNENSMTLTWGSLRQRLPGPYLEELEKKWKAWLRAEKLPERPLPESLGGGDAVSRRFGAILQYRYLEEMRAFLRGIGVKAPISGTNITFTLGDLWASRGMDFLGDHAYWDHPNVRVRPITYRNRPAVRGPAWSLPMVPTFARAKVAGRPVVAGEWNYCFPNDYRCEGLPTMAAFAAYQDWDALLFYCATGSFDGGRWERFHKTPGILVHSQQTDPATWGLSPLCSLLFRRGDVAPARKVVMIGYDPERVWENRSVLARMPFLPALARIETRLTPRGAARLDWPMSASKDALPEDLYATALERLGNTRSSRQTVVSDTGQIRRHADESVLLIDTPRTQIATGFIHRLPDMEDRLTDLGIESATRFATVGLISLDGRPVRDSTRLLLVAVANARNADTKCGGGRLEVMGKGPVLAEPVAAKLTLRSSHAARMEIHALDPLTGKRGQPLEPTATDVDFTFSIGARYRTIYYELRAP
ncbi:MAG: glycoside hydrolase family 5 protein [Kiritimatiellaeota bacterium]|nr:glycoside hydrolase family 5 protein [Kiritimatiellota bacterium]